MRLLAVSYDYCRSQWATAPRTDTGDELSSESISLAENARTVGPASKVRLTNRNPALEYGDTNDR